VFGCVRPLTPEEDGNDDDDDADDDMDVQKAHTASRRTLV